MSSITIRPCVITVLCALSTLCHAASLQEKTASYLIIQVPGALGTYPTSVNDSMAVTGIYYTASGTRGFLRDADGTITTFSVANSALTAPQSINAAGDITGVFSTATGNQGFVRNADGRVVTFSAPASVPKATYDYLEVAPFVINDYGEIAGNFYYEDQTIPQTIGFLRTTAGAYKTYRYATATPTLLTGLNASGTVVGYIEVPMGGDINQSFYVTADGFQTSFHFPLELSADYHANDEETVAETIAADGTIAGYYSAGLLCLTCADRSFSRINGGFVRSAQGDFTRFQTPGTSAPYGMHINGNDALTGYYFDAKDAQHGFVRDAYGIVTSFDPPRGMSTTPTSINDSGVITGGFSYTWSPQVSVGFLRIPKP